MRLRLLDARARTPRAFLRLAPAIEQVVRGAALIIGLSQILTPA